MSKQPKAKCDRCGLSGEHADQDVCMAALQRRVKHLDSSLKKIKHDDRLNDLNGSEWLFSTNTWWETNYRIDPSHKLRSELGSVKPPLVGRDLAKIFTCRRQVVVDTFAGTGGLLLGADIADRVALGCELNPKMVRVIENVREQYGFTGDVVLPRAEAESAFNLRVDSEDCLTWIRGLDTNSVHFAMIDPPYGVAHKKTIQEGSFALDDLEPDDGWGRLETFDSFLDQMRIWGLEMRRVLKAGKYVAVFMTDRYINGELVPLGAMVQQALHEAGLVRKSIRVWRNAASEGKLRPYAIKQAYVPNIKHQYVLIHRKD